jgi:cytochrome c oxidase subunit 2
MIGLPTPLSEQGQVVSDVWRIFLVGAVTVGGLILALLAIIVIRFRRRGDGLPEQVHYRIRLEVAYTVVPLLAVVGLLALTLTSLSDVEATEQNPDVVVAVTAFQWQWRFEYTDAAVRVGQPDDENPPVLVLPTDSIVEFRLDSRDVIHSFWVPGFLTKRDIIPGRPETLQVTVTGQPGTYPAACAEFCGLDHATMRFDLQIMAADEFEAWLDGQQEGITP